MLAVPITADPSKEALKKEIASYKKSIPPGGFTVETLRDLHTQGAWPNPVSTIDASKIHLLPSLPGANTGTSLLPQEQSLSPDLSVGELVTAATTWSAEMIGVVDKLPLAAFVYCLIEFLFLRPGVERYKEDIESSPMRAFTDTAAVMAVRLVLMSVVASVTLWLFYGL